MTSEFDDASAALQRQGAEAGVRRDRRIDKQVASRLAADFQEFCCDVRQLGVRQPALHVGQVGSRLGLLLTVHGPLPFWIR